MKTPAPADLQRWTEEVARDPASLAFLPLARAYRRMGRREAALQLCLRGLEAYPHHADAHSLLALLHLERGERDKAADEWGTVLRLDPNHFEALRGMGFCYLEQDQLSRARHALERAALLRPGDAAVQEALRLLGARQELHGAEHAGSGAQGWAFADAPAEARPPAVPAELPEVVAADSVAPAPGDPASVFAGVTNGPLLGVLLLDAQGLVLAGRLENAARSEALAAVLSGMVGEAGRAAAHLGLGEWSGLLVEAEHMLLHVAPAVDGGVLVVAARRDTPAGWLVRTATQAREVAARFLESYA